MCHISLIAVLVSERGRIKTNVKDSGADRMCTLEMPRLNGRREREVSLIFVADRKEKRVALSSSWAIEFETAACRHKDLVAALPPSPTSFVN